MYSLKYSRSVVGCRSRGLNTILYARMARADSQWACGQRWLELRQQWIVRQTTSRRWNREALAPWSPDTWEIRFPRSHTRPESIIINWSQSFDSSWTNRRRILLSADDFIIITARQPSWKTRYWFSDVCSRVSVCLKKRLMISNCSNVAGICVTVNPTSD